MAPDHRRRLHLAAALSVVLAAGPAFSQAQSEMNQDAGARLKAANRALNATYGKLLADSSLSGRARLRAAQRNWLKFRQADCQARTGARGGSAYPMVFADCMRIVTDARTAQLKAELNCPEGDLGCGGHRDD